MDTKHILEQVRDGAVSVEEAEQYFRRAPFEELGYAKLDTHRRLRSGFAEVVFAAAGSTTTSSVSSNGWLLRKAKCWAPAPHPPRPRAGAGRLRPGATYDPISRLLKLEKHNKTLHGNIAVCTAGTADIAVAEEAAQTAEFFGSKVTRVYDVGVSGLHRLLANLSQSRPPTALWPWRAWRAHLPASLADWFKTRSLRCPPRWGNGASFGGVSALLTMINSCANGIATVNIDNGYGAGYLATQINRLALGAKE